MKKGDVGMAKRFSNKTLSRALDPRANSAWLSKLTETWSNYHLRSTDNWSEAQSVTSWSASIKIWFLQAYRMHY